MKLDAEFAGQKVGWVSRRLVLLAFLAMLGTQPGALWAGINEWTSIGPDGGWIYALAIDPKNPSTLYAESRGGGVFKSTNGGTSWVHLTPTPAPTNNNNLALVIDPQDTSTLYAGTFGAGVFKSTDGGASWSSVSSGLPLNCTFIGVKYLAIDPQNPSTLYVYERNDCFPSTYPGVYKSTDGGASWSAGAVNFGMPTPPNGAYVLVNALAIDPQNPSTLYAGTNIGVLKTTDGGTSWSAANFGLPNDTPNGFYGTSVNALAIDPQNTSTVYAAVNNMNGLSPSDGLFKSTDGGASWNALKPGPLCCVFALAIDPQSPSALYAVLGPDVSPGPFSRLFKSTDAGESWADTGLPRVLAVAIDPLDSGRLYAGTDGGGVFRSGDGGTSWSAINSGLRASGVYNLVTDPQNTSTLYATVSACCPPSAGLFKSTDGGTSWSLASSGLPENVVGPPAIDPQNPSTIYTGGWDWAGVFKSTDGGVSWSAANSGLNLQVVSTLVIDPQNSSTIYAGGWRGLFKSADGGATWLDTQAPVLNSVGKLAIDIKNPGTIYAAGSIECMTRGCIRVRVLKSTDGGGTWTAADFAFQLGDFIAGISVFAFDPQNPSTVYAATGGWDAPQGSVWKSTDGGTSWLELNYRSDFMDEHGWAPDVSALAIDPQNPSTLYAGAFDYYAQRGGVLKSVDGGASWSAVNSGLTMLNVQTLAIDPQNPSTVYAGTNGGGVFAITFVP
jgi:photosystem II stability/assembly factor-like uncharacterized protein